MNSTERRPVEGQTPGIVTPPLSRGEKVAIGCILPVGIAVLMITRSPQLWFCVLPAAGLSEIFLVSALLGLPTRE